MALSEHPIGPACAVSDLARARAFYEDQLGLTGEQVMDEAVRYPAATGRH